jgi:hypothetical protein
VKRYGCVKSPKGSKLLYFLPVLGSIR